MTDHQDLPLGANPPADPVVVLAGLVISGAIALMGNWVASGTPPQEALPGLALLILFSLIGLGVGRLVPLRLPDVAWITLVTILVTLPAMPTAAPVAALTAKIGFLPLATPVLTYAGLALSPAEFRIARQSGWKIVILAICVAFGTFLGSAVIADLVLQVQG